VKTRSQHSRKPIKWENVKTWLAPLSAIITVIIALYGIYNQARLEDANRRQEHEKWEKDFAAQIQLAETNRQRDFLVWQQQHSQEWTQQLVTLEVQQKKLDLSEKEGLYQEFVFHMQKVVKLMDDLSWSEWRFYCYAEAEIKMPAKSSAADIREAKETLQNEEIRWRNNAEKMQTELDDEKVTVLRLMQSVKFKFSNPIEAPINRGILEMADLQIWIPSSPEVDAAIHQIFQNSTNSWDDLSDYFIKNIRRFSKPENFQKAWETVDEMMYREVVLQREGIEIKSEYLTNSGPIVLGNGKGLVFKREISEKPQFVFGSNTNQAQQSR
jgi:hypothetical protein